MYFHRKSCLHATDIERLGGSILRLFYTDIVQLHSRHGGIPGEGFMIKQKQALARILQFMIMKELAFNREGSFSIQTYIKLLHRLSILTVLSDVPYANYAYGTCVPYPNRLIKIADFKRSIRIPKHILYKLTDFKNNTYKRHEQLISKGTCASVETKIPNELLRGNNLSIFFQHKHS